MIIQTFWLKKNLMTVSIAEANHLILYRRAVARADSVNLARIDWSSIEIIFYNLMRLRGCSGNVTRYLPRCYAISQC